MEAQQHIKGGTTLVVHGHGRPDLSLNVVITKIDFDQAGLPVAVDDAIDPTHYRFPELLAGEWRLIKMNPMTDAFETFLTGLAIALAAAGIWLYLATVF